MQDWLLADRRVTGDESGLHYGERLGAAPVQRNGNGGILTQPAPAPQPVPVPSNATDWHGGLAQALAEVVVATKRELRAEHNKALVSRDQRIASLQRQVNELAAKLAAVSAELARADKDRAAAHALVVRIARLEGLFEGRLRSLSAFADAHGVTA